MSEKEQSKLPFPINFRSYETLSDDQQAQLLNARKGLVDAMIMDAQQRRDIKEAREHRATLKAAGDAQYDLVAIPTLTTKIVPAQQKLLEVYQAITEHISKGSELGALIADRAAIDKAIKHHVLHLTIDTGKMIEQIISKTRFAARENLTEAEQTTLKDLRNKLVASLFSGSEFIKANARGALSDFYSKLPVIVSGGRLLTPDQAAKEDFSKIFRTVETLTAKREIVR